MTETEMTPTQERAAKARAVRELNAQVRIADTRLRPRGWICTPPDPTPDDLQAAAVTLRSHGWTCVAPEATP